jgi:hypothetical protein
MEGYWLSIIVTILLAALKQAGGKSKSFVSRFCKISSAPIDYASCPLRNQSHREYHDWQSACLQCLEAARLNCSTRKLDHDADAHANTFNKKAIVCQQASVIAGSWRG